MELSTSTGRLRTTLDVSKLSTANSGGSIYRSDASSSKSRVAHFLREGRGVRSDPSERVVRQSPRSLFRRSGSPLSFTARGRARRRASYHRVRPTVRDACHRQSHHLLVDVGEFRTARRFHARSDVVEQQRTRATHAQQIDSRPGERRASSNRAPLAASPAIIRAKRSASSARLGSTATGTASPCRNAFREAAEFPAGVLGPVLRRAFARLARTRVESFIRRRPRLGSLRIPRLRSGSRP